MSLERFQQLVDRHNTKHVELPVYFEIIAQGDGEGNDEHHVRMGPGQRSGMKRLLAALGDWKKGQR